MNTLSNDFLESLYGPLDSEANKANVIELSHSSAEMYEILKPIPFVAQHHVCHKLGDALVELFKARILSYYPSRTRLERTGTTLFRLMVDGAYIVHGTNMGDQVRADVYGFQPGPATMFNPEYFHEYRSRLEVVPNATGGGTIRLFRERLWFGSFELIHIKTAHYTTTVDEGLVGVGFY